jgi:hypothetical protein
MTLTKCPVEGCEHIGGIWQGWTDLKSDGVWVCADHYPLPTKAVCVECGVVDHPHYHAQ